MAGAWNCSVALTHRLTLILYAHCMQLTERNCLWAYKEKITLLYSQNYTVWERVRQLVCLFLYLHKLFNVFCGCTSWSWPGSVLIKISPGQSDMGMKAVHHCSSCFCMCLSAIACVRVTVRSFISMTMMPEIDTCLAILVLSRLLWRSGGCVLAYRGLGKDLDFVF